ACERPPRPRLRTFVDVASSPPHEALVSKLPAMLRRGRFPCLHHRKEGWPSDQEKCREASAFREDGVVFRPNTKEHHPGCVDSEASRPLLDDAATPPRG